MADITIQRYIPRGALVGAGLLLAATIALAGITHATNAQHIALAPTHAVASIDLAFRDLPDGGVAVTEGGSGRAVATVAPESGHFLRGIMRALVFGHRRAGEQGQTAFRLTRWADGRLSIADPVTAESFDLEAFGSTNAEVFARFLDAPSKLVADKAAANKT